MPFQERWSAAALIFISEVFAGPRWIVSTGLAENIFEITCKVSATTTVVMAVLFLFLTMIAHPGSCFGKIGESKSRQ